MTVGERENNIWTGDKNIWRENIKEKNLLEIT